MREVANGVWQLSGYPRDRINAYLVGDVLIDAGTRWARGWLLRQLRGRTLSLVALTHCHPDHQGVARLVCEKYHVPLACHEADVDVMEGRVPMGPRNWLINLGIRFWAGPPCKVERVLRAGDEVAGFRVVHAPGHTPGHVIYFRESDRVAIAGDVLANINFLTGKVGLRQPPRYFSVDAEANRRSIRLLAELRPTVVCFGHGPPLREPGLLLEYVARWRGREAVPAPSP
jgi:glyoxylase-like metal-dependent hydrolase (beta-lactamase superfamily II)